VIGATGVNDRTGEFYIFKAKAVVVATGIGMRLFGFAPEVTESASMYDVNQVAMGHIIGWNAGAEFVNMDQIGKHRLSGFGYAPYSTGNADNTYQGAPAVDADGKRIAHANSYGELLNEERQIFQPSRPDKFVIGHGIALQMPDGRDYNITNLDSGIGDKVRSGELQLPLYTDFTLLDEKHRWLIWGMMLSQEGKCRVPIYETFTQWGFDPAKDLLQQPVHDPSMYSSAPAWCGLGGHTPANWRAMGYGGFLTDWRLQTTLPGLFAAGGAPAFGSGCHGESHTSGRYAGRQAAAFAGKSVGIEPDARQIQKEKDRCYAPVRRDDGDIGWKEMNYAISRVMQDYCGEYKTERTLDMGLKRLGDLLETEGERTYAGNPHELVRLLECFGLVDMGRLCIEAAKARKCSSRLLGFYRLDYPEVDPPEWHCFVPVSQKDGAVNSRKLPVDYYLQAPYSGDLEENYRQYAEL
jgi:succinate dehydrogenase/fumarate reductase flavoprotein subunit